MFWDLKHGSQAKEFLNFPRLFGMYLTPPDHQNIKIFFWRVATIFAKRHWFFVFLGLYIETPGLYLETRGSAGTVTHYIIACTKLSRSKLSRVPNYRVWGGGRDKMMQWRRNNLVHAIIWCSRKFDVNAENLGISTKIQGSTAHLDIFLLSVLYKY